MTMMTTPATIASSADQARTRPPTTLALAPSATNTVEKPSTKATAASMIARLAVRLAPSCATCSTLAPVR